MILRATESGPMCTLHALCACTVGWGVGDVVWGGLAASFANARSILGAHDAGYDLDPLSPDEDCVAMAALR